MNPNEFAELILVYGADLDRWPDSLRSQAQTLVATDKRAASLLQREQSLADLLDEAQVPAMAGLEQRVLRQALPPQRSSKINALLNWLLPGEVSHYWWRPALAATVPLVFGIVLGNFFSFGISSTSETQDWADEMYLLSLTDYPDL